MCRAYRQPLYVYARRWGLDHQDAEDVVQQVLSLMSRPRFLDDVDPALGRFRNFLLGVLRNVVRKLRNRGPQVTSLDADSRLGEALPASERNPEEAYHRSFAVTVIELAQRRLADECSAAGKSEFFEAVQPFLAGSDWQARFAELGDRFGMTEGATRVAVHRLRRRVGELLREEVRRIVCSDGEVDEELRWLLTSVSG